MHNSYSKQAERLEKSNSQQIEEFLLYKDFYYSAAFYQNRKIFNLISPLLQEKNKWLTVGDFRGLDAYSLKINGQYAVASDLSDKILKYAKQYGLIDEAKIINAEKIDYPDNYFDYVLCKQAFHHFPKAYIALYEMIRVAKKGFVLIEPIDPLCQSHILLFLKNFLDNFSPTLINKIWKNRFSFEPVGNYVFKISVREIEKFAMGLGLNLIAYKPINLINFSHLIKKYKPQAYKIPADKKLLKKMNFKLSMRNFFSKIKLLPYKHTIIIVFKELPNQKTINQLKKYGYKLLYLPKNPYL